LSREPFWTKDVAVGDKRFVDMIKMNVGRYVNQPSLFEEPGTFGEQESVAANMLDWQVFEDRELG
jgi:hypothetical protein